MDALRPLCSVAARSSCSRARAVKENFFIYEIRRWRVCR
ncbi:hypothetical protein I552_5443 [Mycobacterium xenopi 3993]|nr:hypothetical protein I552_5443 [Mycobacterium xenopi 3993]